MQPKPHFCLFVAGAPDRTRFARAAVRQALEQCLDPDGFDLEVFDILQNPDIADRHRIIATPTLIRQSPLPEVRAIGDLTNIKAFFSAFGLRSRVAPR